MIKREVELICRQGGGWSQRSNIFADVIFGSSIVATLVEPLRQHGKNGIYEATMVHTRQADGRNGPGGYFGVQWKGTSSKADTLLFSIWDEKEERVIPLMTPNEEARNETEPGSTP